MVVVIAVGTADPGAIAGGAVGAGSVVGTGGAEAQRTDGCGAAIAHDPGDGRYQWRLPRGFPTPAVPADNPMSDAKVALGRRLFFEPRLSITGRYSCASCHQPSLAYSDGRGRAVGATGGVLPHSAMSLVNVAYQISFGWTKPELQSLEAQMREPLFNQHPVEIGLAGREDDLRALLAADGDYREAFRQAFGGRGGECVVTTERIVKAIAAFERTLIFGDSPFDRYVFRADHDALTPEAKRGMALFYSARVGCGSCHSGFNFDGNWRDSKGETGKSSFAYNGVGNRRMRMPTLRNIVLTAPYMHDGRFSTLGEVLNHYEKFRGFNLSAGERGELIAFLDALTDSEFAGGAGGQPGR